MVGSGEGPVLLRPRPGVGPGRRRARRRHFGSRRAVREAGEEALCDVPRISAGDASTIRRFFEAAGERDEEASAVDRA